MWRETWKARSIAWFPTARRSATLKGIPIRTLRPLSSARRKRFGSKMDGSALGQWQRIFFAEFDGPRTRQLRLKIVPDSVV